MAIQVLCTQGVPGKDRITKNEPRGCTLHRPSILHDICCVSARAAFFISELQHARQNSLCSFIGCRCGPNPSPKNTPPRSGKAPRLFEL